MVAVVEFGTSWCFVVADCYIRDSGGLVINHNTQFFTFIVRAAGVKFDGRVSHYIISGELVCVCIYIYIYIE